MKILFFDATQDWIHISLSELIESNGNELKLLFEKVEYCPRESSFRLVSEIQKALLSFQWNKPDLIVCLTGPGSFTGIRITVSTGRNLSQLWEIPVVGIDSLNSYATHFESILSIPVFIAIDGKQNKRYFGRKEYKKYTGSEDWDEKLISGEVFKFTKTKHQFVYSGIKPACFPSDALKIEETLPRSMPILKEIKDKILKLDYEEYNFNQLIPNYVRGSYVETNKK
jgi:tRNA threonylcarbamoyl adenosine modification protein YeaZ